eukprot:Pgem_evm1s14337
MDFETQQLEWAMQLSMQNEETRLKNEQQLNLALNNSRGIFEITEWTGTTGNV